MQEGRPSTDSRTVRLNEAVSRLHRGQPAEKHGYFWTIISCYPTSLPEEDDDGCVVMPVTFYYGTPSLCKIN